ncbi:DDE-type integrase/transposase/recombinase [Mesorhizobium sp. M0220]|uniref:DDE-type integrase/transposase/recombinase n=1 Tax=Mesorhizobium sp. M0220 TaxID=2956920 RepID=UPI003338A094
MDETYVRVGLEMEYLFPAVDKHGRLIDFMRPAQHRAVYRLLRKALWVCPAAAVPWLWCANWR